LFLIGYNIGTGGVTTMAKSGGKDGMSLFWARAMVLLLRYTGLRISDVASLRRDRVTEGKILLHTQKTGGLVYLPMPVDLQWALDALPAPKGTLGDPQYFFWTGVTSRRAAVGIAERTLAAVFKRSQVEKAHAHGFRHTLAHASR
jgi:integrase